MSKSETKSEIDNYAIIQELEKLYNLLLLKATEKANSGDYESGELSEIAEALEKVGEQVLMFKKNEQSTR